MLGLLNVSSSSSTCHLFKVISWSSSSSDVWGVFRCLQVKEAWQLLISHTPKLLLVP
uniref:Macaca fascicularis brain cDNA, clone: QtrA-18630 n=1 Tax=Macaca fascicularis TaxID=9541 RepID=I7GJI2_MACFA|nr:unnamed protein product [Macaca fascicularis]